MHRCSVLGSRHEAALESKTWRFSYGESVQSRLFWAQICGESDLTESHMGGQLKRLPLYPFLIFFVYYGPEILR